MVIEIFNMQGRRVTSLVDATLGIGKHNVVWQGHEVPAGTYFARLRVGSDAALLIINRLD